MLRLTPKIQIGNRTIIHLTKVDISKSWKTLTDTCKITFARQPAQKLNFKKGETISINLGYDFQYTERFTGYITRIEEIDNLLILHGEDEAYTLKKIKAPQKAIRNANLKTIFQTLEIPKFEISGDINIGNYRIEQSTTAKAIAELKNKYSIAAFYIEKTLYAGLPYTLLAKINQKTVKLAFTKNIISDNLAVQTTDEERPIQIKAIIISTTDTKVKNITIGESGGEERTIHYINATEESVKKQALSTIELLQKKSTISGTITIFGLPICNVGDTLILQDPDNIKQGKFIINEVKIQFGQSGYRQDITIEKSLT